MDFKISVALHIIGFIMWTGSLLISSRIIALSAKNNQIASVSAWTKKITFGWMLPGLFLTIITGTYQLLSRGMSYYMTQGWFHGKLTLALILVVASVLMIKVVSNPTKESKLPMAIHGTAGLCMFLIVFLTIIGK